MQNKYVTSIVKSGEVGPQPLDVFLDASHVQRSLTVIWADQSTTVHCLETLNTWALIHNMLFLNGPAVMPNPLENFSTVGMNINISQLNDLVIVYWLIFIHTFIKMEGSL